MNNSKYFDNNAVTASGRGLPPTPSATGASRPPVTTPVNPFDNQDNHNQDDHDQGRSSRTGRSTGSGSTSSSTSSSTGARARSIEGTQMTKIRRNSKDCKVNSIATHEGFEEGDEEAAEQARAEMMHGWYIDCTSYYADTFFRKPGTGIRKDIATIIRDGMSGECLCAIMDEAGEAPFPSWKYAMKIVKRCQREGIMTLEAWLKNKEEREAQQNEALRYHERQYQDGDFGPDFFRGTPRRQSGQKYAQREFKAGDFGEDFFVNLDDYGNGEARRQ